MPSKLSLFLIGSLAVNAALLGIVGGRFVNGQATAGKEPSVIAQLERYGPTADVVRDAWAQLPEEDRVVLRKELRDSWVSLEGERKRLSDAGKAVFNAALTEPYEEGKLRDAVTIFQTRERALQQAAENILISHLRKMPADARATAAVGLLTPFNVRMQRTSEQRKDEGKPGKEGKSDGRALPPPPAAPPAKPN
jgi:uncharacterized membrane protein